MDATRPLAQVIAILLGIISVVSCLCGGLLTLSAISTSDPLIMPDGSMATLPDTTNTIIITLCLSAVFALTLLMVAAAIWYLFGRQDSSGQVLPKMAVLVLLIGGMFLVLWGCLVAVTAVLTDGMTALGSQVGTIPGLLGSLACLVPGAILIMFSLFVWLFFVRGKMTPVEETAVTDSPPVTTYLTFMQSILPRLQSEEIDAAIQVRTMLALQEATAVDQVKIITFLFETNLIVGQTPEISLRGCQLSQINLAAQHLPAINLVGTNLTAANFHETDLTDANMADATLSSADLRAATLTNANLQNTNLRQAKCHRAICHKTNLQGADLANANFWRADLSGSFVSDAQLAVVVSLDEAILPDEVRS